VPASLGRGSWAGGEPWSKQYLGDSLYAEMNDPTSSCSPRKTAFGLLTEFVWKPKVLSALIDYIGDAYEGDETDD
jgi:hypothetical protein